MSGGAEAAAKDTAACGKAGARALRTTRSTLSGRPLLNCCRALALSHVRAIRTSNTLVKSTNNSRSDGTRLKASMHLALVTLSRLSSVPPLENRLATALSVVQDEG